MRYYGGVMVALVACLGGTIPALANAQLSVSHGCPVENAQVSVNLNGMGMDVSVVRSRLDTRFAELKALAEEQHFAKLVTQSYNYSISTSNNGGETQYQYNGSVSFLILPADKAVSFMELLAKKGYQASVNVSSYNGGNCSPSLEK